MDEGLANDDDEAEASFSIILCFRHCVTGLSYR